MSIRPALKTHRKLRAGFTLVEMLVVIVIIGMLMALLSVAIWGVVTRAREAAVLVEIDNLVNSVQAYKEKNLVYPPSMAEVTTTARSIHFLRHIRTVYPSSNYNVTQLDFDRLNDRVRQWYRVRTSAGTQVDLDLSRIDQAEALVFWLGGFPTPHNVMSATSATASNMGPGPVAAQKLFGFNNDADNPFKRSNGAIEGQQPLQTRTKKLFDFDETRLTDVDNDGWWEYAPNEQSGAAVAPFVYFDAEAYGGERNSFTGYPRQGDTGAQGLYQQWGLAVPFAAYFDPRGDSPTQWQRGDSFQIVSGGLDGVYSTPVGANPSQGMCVPVFPSGFIYMASNYSSPPRSYTNAELDNLTSLEKARLDKARDQAQK